MKKTFKWLSIIIIICTFLLSISFLLYPNVYISYPYYTQINDAYNQQIYSYCREKKSEYTPLNKVSSAFIKTLIQIEDKRFYSHHGFDYARIFQSAFKNLKNNNLNQGASTITQQLARTLYLNNSKSFTRKINEAYIAKKIEMKYTKNYILELYINSVYFAHNLYGISAASNYYFNKTPEELNYQDACILVGIINAPNIYSPFINYDLCMEKMKSIAYKLYSDNIIDVKEYYHIISTPPQLYGNEEELTDSFSYYYQAIKKELTKNNISLSKNNTEGYIIDTYFDRDIQNIVDTSIASYKFEDEVAAIVMKPYSSKVLALCGGKDFSTSQFNRALDAKREIGSTIKPFIYYLNLINGLSPLSEFTSKPTKFTLEDGTIYNPKNATDTYAYRKINMIEALALSDNIYAVKSAFYIGSKNIANFIKQFNVEVDNTNITIALGNISMTPLQLIAMYNCLASEGIFYQPKFVSKIKKNSNEIIYNASSSGKRILNEKETILLNYMLQSPFDAAFTSYASPTMKNYQVNRQFCVKTGTTSTSSYTVGFNNEYTVLVYVGNDNGQLRDGTASKRIFQNIVNKLPQENESTSFYKVLSNTRLIQFHNSLYNLYSKKYLTYRFD